MCVRSDVVAIAVALLLCLIPCTSAHTLSTPRDLIASASTAMQLIFAGGWNGASALPNVDVYNITTGTWFSTALTQARAGACAVSWELEYSDVNVGRSFGPDHWPLLYGVRLCEWRVVSCRGSIIIRPTNSGSGDL